MHNAYFTHVALRQGGTESGDEKQSQNRVLVLIPEHTSELTSDSSFARITFHLGLILLIASFLRKRMHSKHSTHRLPDLDTGSAESLGLMWTGLTRCKHRLLFASVKVISLQNFRQTTVIGSCPLRPVEDPVPVIHHQITQQRHV